MSTAPIVSDSYKRPNRRFIKGPDRKAKEASVAVLKDKIKEVDFKLSKVNETIANFKSDDKSNDRRKELQNELNELIKIQSDLKNKRNIINDKIKAVDGSLKKKIADLNSQSSKIRFKSIGEIDKQIQKLDDAIASGNLKIVEERRNVKEISALRKIKKDFGQIESAQKAIDDDKAKIAVLKKELSALNNKEIQTKFENVTKELNTIRDSNKSVNDKKKVHYDQRGTLQKEKNSYYDEIRKINSEYEEAYDKFKKDLAAEKERAKKDEEDYLKQQEKAKKEKQLKEELENASKPAFESQISSIKILIKYFSKLINQPVPEDIVKDDEESSVTKKFGDLSLNTNGTTSTGRVVAMPENYVVVKKEQEVFFQGSKGKKSKKTKKHGGDEKLIVEPDVIVQLSELGLLVPTSKEAASNVIEELLKQFSIFKKDQDEVTKKNVEKAKTKIAAFEKKQKAAEAAEEKETAEEEKEEKKEEEGEEGEEEA